MLCSETGSLSAASRRAHCSVSAASERLSALEDALGQRLFLRDHRGLRITAAGELLVRHGALILERLQLLHGQLAAPELATAALQAGEDAVPCGALTRAPASPS